MKKLLSVFLISAAVYSSVSYGAVYMFKNNFISSQITILRDKTTDCATFVETTKKIVPSLVFAVGECLDFSDKTVETPCGVFENGCELKRNPIFVPVLRAGLSLLDAFRDYFPGASCGFYGIKRNEETALPSTYYRNVPEQICDNKVVILETMLATGGTVCMTIDDLKEKHGVINENIIVVAVISAVAGLERLETQYPGITIVTCAVDVELNEKKYIVPGLGDFGDRFFGNDCEQLFTVLQQDE
jgi:uracil phosphoribosyltransferase